MVEKVKECYAGLFTDRAIFYRVQKGFDHLSIALSVVVQLMVYSRASGVMFTLNVANGDSSVILIEAGYGLGEYVVQGKITPDEYLVRKSDKKFFLYRKYKDEKEARKGKFQDNQIRFEDFRWRLMG